MGASLGNGEVVQTVGPQGPTATRLAPTLVHVLLTGGAAAGVALDYGFPSPLVSPPVYRTAQILLLAAFYLDLLRRSRSLLPDPLATSRSKLEWLLPGLVLMGFGVQYFTGGVVGWIVLELAAVFLFVIEIWRLQLGLARRLARPGLLLPMSFASIIATGTVLLKLPTATVDSIGWLDALFTMTSAVCVTGLAVKNTAHDFTPFGQFIIGLFIQVGGLGIITFSATFALLIGRSLSLRENISLSEVLSDQPLSKVGRYIRFIVLTTITLELLGALVLFPLWSGDLTLEQRAGQSLFHSISAFCNAGFDITGDSLVPYRFSVLAGLVIPVLIVVGGLGFPAIGNLGGVIAHRCARVLPALIDWFPRRFAKLDKRLTLHTKLVLWTSAGLYLYGVVAIAACQFAAIDLSEARESGGAVGAMAHRLADSHFMSITSRTAGFSSMPMDELAPGSRFTIMTLMLVGGSPGSTAGGMKTTVLAVLVLSVLATLRQRGEVEIFKRALTDQLVRRASTLAVTYVGAIALGSLLLLMIEPFHFDAILFEAVSAATTTGLSLGITPELSWPSKLVVIALMYLGRIGPLALMAGLTFRMGVAQRHAYPREDVRLS